MGKQSSPQVVGNHGVYLTNAAGRSTVAPQRREQAGFRGMRPEDNLLVLCRHGQSETNRDNVFTGLLDPPLTQVGVAQSLQVGAFLAHYPSLQGGEERLSVAFTSNQIRAQTSLAHILSLLPPPPPPIVRTAVLNERDYGKLNGLNKDAVALEYGEEQTELWRRSFSAVPPGGESLEMVCAKVWTWYESEVRPRLKRGAKVLVVSSGNTLRALVMQLERLEQDAVRALQLGPAATRVYRFGEGGEVRSCEVFQVQEM